MRAFQPGFLCLVALATIPFSLCLHAQSFTTSACTDDDHHHSGGWFGNGETACESRRTTLPLVDGHLRVSGTNGGIEVVGEDRRDVALEARVTAHGSSQDDAMAVVHRVEIVTHGTIHATGPHTSGWTNHSWTVDYTLRVPRQLAADLNTTNGGITLTDIDGAITAETTNGGLTLRNLAGDVHASTTNGGVHIAVAGKQWHGTGLAANAVNGGITVKAPDGYSAHLVASTVNGGIAVKFPITMQGEIRNHLDTNLGGGGATLQLETVNGGIAVSHD